MESLALRSRLPSNTGPAATTHTHSRSQHAGNRNAGSNVNTEHELALPNIVATGTYDTGGDANEDSRIRTNLHVGGSTS